MGRIIQELAPLSHCAEFCGLSAKEMIVGSTPRPEHALLAETYFCSPNSRKLMMRVAIVSAIRAALKDQHLPRAAELLVALRVMLATGRGQVGAKGRQARQKFRQKGWPLERLLETRRDARAILVDLAERSAAPIRLSTPLRVRGYLFSPRLR